MRTQVQVHSIKIISLKVQPWLLTWHRLNRSKDANLINGWHIFLNRQGKHHRLWEFSNLIFDLVAFPHIALGTLIVCWPQSLPLYEIDGIRLCMIWCFVESQLSINLKSSDKMPLNLIVYVFEMTCTLYYSNFLIR